MTTKRPDLYAVLGLTPQATQDQIGHAYRALLRRHHPDTRPRGDESQDALSDAALQQVLAAYAVLGDPARRAGYDRQSGVRSRPRVARITVTVGGYGRYGWPPILVGPVRWHRRPS